MADSGTTVSGGVFKQRGERVGEPGPEPGYFGSYGITGNLIIIALYIATAITVAITGTSLLARRAATGKPAAAVL
jgi:hypothetical protein